MRGLVAAQDDNLEADQAIGSFDSAFAKSANAALRMTGFLRRNAALRNSADMRGGLPS